MTAEEFISRLERVKKTGPGWVGRCPAHEDKEPSLKIDVGNDDEILLHCHAGCTTDAIVKAMDLELRDLFPDRDDSPFGKTKTIEAVYDYVDEDEVLLYQAVRYKPKSFSQRRPDGSGDWTWSMEGVRRVLYHLPEVIKAVAEGKRIWIVEGEKDADRLRVEGEIATTNVGGAGKWRPEYTEFLKVAKTIIVVADRDGPGLKSAEKLIAELESAGCANVVGVQAKIGKDAYDHLEAGLGLDEFERLDSRKKADGIVLEKFSTIQAVPPTWVEGLEGFVPFKAITLLAGEQGTNKSTFACYLAEKITRIYGRDVFYITDEGDPGVEIKPRLLAAGADVDRCHFVRRMIDGFEGSVFFPIDIRELEVEVRRTGAGLVVIDPVLAHIDVEDTNNDNSIRTALAPLQKMAQRNDLIVLLIAHINKDRSIDPFKRVGGSKGLTGVSRSNLMMGKLTDGHEARAIASFKSSWDDPTSALHYRIDRQYVADIEGFSIRLASMGTINVRASSLLAEGRSEL